MEADAETHRQTLGGAQEVCGGLEIEKSESEGLGTSQEDPWIQLTWDCRGVQSFAHQLENMCVLGLCGSPNKQSRDSLSLFSLPLAPLSPYLASVGQDVPRPAGTRCPGLDWYPRWYFFSAENGRGSRGGICKSGTGKRGGRGAMAGI